jgi:hypothetical protein
MRNKTRPPKQFAEFWASRCVELLQTRSNVPQKDIEYLAEAVEKLRDERLKSIVAALIGWGDDERAELETFCAIAIEVLRKANLSKIQDAQSMVELRFFTRDLK